MRLPEKYENEMKDLLQEEYEPRSSDTAGISN